MSTSSPVSSQQSAISMALRISPQRPLGSRVEETQKGHMWIQHQGVHYTKKKAEISQITETSVSVAQMPKEDEEAPATVKNEDRCTATYNPRDTMFANQTGKFPHSSSRGNNYQMIIHEIDGKSTWVEATKNKTEEEMIVARRQALKRMQLQGIIPKHQVLDNETSAPYKAKIVATNMTYQLVPPDDHRRNIAEKAIQTWKDHFVGVLGGMAATFPMHI